MVKNILVLTDYFGQEKNPNGGIVMILSVAQFESPEKNVLIFSAQSGNTTLN